MVFADMYLPLNFQADEEQLIIRNNLPCILFTKTYSIKGFTAGLLVLQIHLFHLPNQQIYKITEIVLLEELCEVCLVNLRASLLEQFSISQGFLCVLIDAFVFFSSFVLNPLNIYPICLSIEISRISEILRKFFSWFKVLSTCFS